VAEAPSEEGFEVIEAANGVEAVKRWNALTGWIWCSPTFRYPASSFEPLTPITATPEALAFESVVWRAVRFCDAWTQPASHHGRRCHQRDAASANRPRRAAGLIFVNAAMCMWPSLIEAGRPTSRISLAGIMEFCATGVAGCAPGSDG
jgi:hypothetical protein